MSAEGLECIRDPIWNDIILKRDFLNKLIDNPFVQRLRYVGQMGFNFVVYPGARHSRFEHSIGVYHLCNIFVQKIERALRNKQSSGSTSNNSKKMENVRGFLEVFPIIGLLHDIGHYPLSHYIESRIWKILHARKKILEHFSK